MIVGLLQRMGEGRKKRGEESEQARAISALSPPGSSHYLQANYTKSCLSSYRNQPLRCLNSAYCTLLTYRAWAAGDVSSVRVLGFGVGSGAGSHAVAHGAVGAQCWALVQALLGGISLQSHVWLPGIFGSALAEWSRLLGQLCFRLCFWGEGGRGGGHKAPSPAAKLSEH